MTGNTRKAADSDTDTGAGTGGHPDTTTPAAGPAVSSLTQRRLAHLPADTRPLPSVAVYDQLLPSRRIPKKETRS